MKLAVVILAGGEGRRIGGAKPSRLLGGVSLLDRAEAAARQWSDLVTVSVRDGTQAGTSRLERIFDAPGIEGPLAGLAAALAFAKGEACQAVLTMPADMPFLPAELGQRLVSGIGDAECAVAASGGHLHPVCGLWRVSACRALPAYLQSGRRSLRGFAQAVGFKVVEWPAERVDPFVNINSSEDLARAELLLASRPPD